ncbi:hypothetical protein PENTCL1PPCAC_14802, partial [Pristionchus entomophagus]
VMGIHVHCTARFLPVGPVTVMILVRILIKHQFSIEKTKLPYPLRRRNVDERGEMSEHGGVQRSRPISSEIRLFSKE